MRESIELTDQDNAKVAFDMLAADILAGKVSLFDLLHAVPSGDYWASVQRMRLFHVLSRDPAVLKQLLAELTLKISESGVDPDNRAIEKELADKDGTRRFRNWSGSAP